MAQFVAYRFYLHQKVSNMVLGFFPPYVYSAILWQRPDSGTVICFPFSYLDILESFSATKRDFEGERKRTAKKACLEPRSVVKATSSYTTGHERTGRNEPSRNEKNYENQYPEGYVSSWSGQKNSMFCLMSINQSFVNATRR